MVGFISRAAEALFFAAFGRFSAFSLKQGAGLWEGTQNHVTRLWLTPHPRGRFLSQLPTVCSPNALEASKEVMNAMQDPSFQVCQLSPLPVPNFFSGFKTN